MNVIDYNKILNKAFKYITDAENIIIDRRRLNGDIKNAVAAAINATHTDVFNGVCILLQSLSKELTNTSDKESKDLAVFCCEVAVDNCQNAIYNNSRTPEMGKFLYTSSPCSYDTYLIYFSDRREFLKLITNEIKNIGYNLELRRDPNENQQKLF